MMANTARVASASTADRPYGLSVAARITVPPARSVAATAASVSATA